MRDPPPPTGFVHAPRVSTGVVVGVAVMAIVAGAAALLKAGTSNAVEEQRITALEANMVEFRVEAKAIHAELSNINHELGAVEGGGYCVKPRP